MKQFLLWLLVVVIVVGALWGWNTEWQFTSINSNRAPITGDVIPSTGAMADVTTGWIEASFSYPSEFIPSDMYACAQDVATAKEYCTYEIISHKKYTYGSGFVIAAPAGRYYVYSARESAPAYKGWYSEMVPCGLKNDCPTELIPVVVTGGLTIFGADPADWYTQR